MRICIIGLLGSDETTEARGARASVLVVRRQCPTEPNKNPIQSIGNERKDQNQLESRLNAGRNRLRARRTRSQVEGSRTCTFAIPTARP
jgi:hypothetical protein